MQEIKIKLHKLAL